METFSALLAICVGIHRRTHYDVTVMEAIGTCVVDISTKLPVSHIGMGVF